MENLITFFRDEAPSDVTFVVGKWKAKKEYPGHKALFAAQSSVFGQMFQNDCAKNSKKPNHFCITDIKPKVFEVFRKFIYAENVDLTGDEEAKLCDDLLVVAHKVNFTVKIVFVMKCF